MYCKTDKGETQGLASKETIYGCLFVAKLNHSHSLGLSFTFLTFLFICTCFSFTFTIFFLHIHHFSIHVHDFICLCSHCFEFTCIYFIFISITFPFAFLNKLFIFTTFLSCSPLCVCIHKLSIIIVNLFFSVHIHLNKSSRILSKNRSSFFHKRSSFFQKRSSFSGCRSSFYNNFRSSSGPRSNLIGRQQQQQFFQIWKGIGRLCSKSKYEARLLLPKWLAATVDRMARLFVAL